MANQYTGSFEHIIQQKFSCSAYEVLQRCSDEGMTYQQAEKLLGFKHGTIRKWANRFDIRLKSGSISKTVKDDNFMQMFRQKNINKHNVLSRCWNIKDVLCTKYSAND